MQYPDYKPDSPLTPLTEPELADLDKLLQRLDADTAMSLDGLDGFLTAMAIGPAALRAMPTADWLPLIWGGDPAGPDEAAPFASKRQRKNTVVQALRHLRHLDQLLHHQPEAWEPIFSVAEQGEDELIDAREWCMGFLQAVDLAPGDWGTVWTLPSMAPLLTMGGGLDGTPTPRNDDTDLNDPALCDQLSRAVPDAVLQLPELLRAGGDMA